MANEKISDYTEALSVADDDLLEISVDLGGGSYETRKVKKSNLGGGDNFATADLTLTGNRTHDLDSNILKFDNGQVTIQGNGTTSATTALLVENSSGSDALIIRDDLKSAFRGVVDPAFTLTVRGEDSTSAFGGIKTENSSGTKTFSVDNEGTGYFNKNLYVNERTGINIVPNGTWSLNVKGFTSNIAEGAFNFVNSSNDLIMKGVNNGDVVVGGNFVAGQTGLPSARLHSKGSGSTNATTALLVENSSSTEALKVLDDLAIIMANLPTSSAGLATGQLWNNSGVVNIV
jgi:hypothetical protein